MLGNGEYGRRIVGAGSGEKMWKKVQTNEQ